MIVPLDPPPLHSVLCVFLFVVFRWRRRQQRLDHPLIRLPPLQTLIPRRDPRHQALTPPPAAVTVPRRTATAQVILIQTQTKRMDEVFTGVTSGANLPSVKFRHLAAYRRACGAVRIADSQMSHLAYCVVVISARAAYMCACRTVWIVDVPRN